MMRPLTLTAVALLLLSWSATAGIPSTSAQKTIEKIVTQEAFSSSIIGVFALRMDGDTIAAVNIKQKMVPASNMKLLTTGVALNTLGEDFRFETSIGYTGEILDSTLVGDLYIIGGGDPTTGSKSDCAEATDALFEKWHSLVSSLGIHKIEGSIIGDPRYFDDPSSENSGWLYEDLGTYYGSGPCGLNFYENRQDFWVTPGPAIGNRPNIVPGYPDTPWMNYSITAETGRAKSKNSLFYINTPLAPYGQISGSFPIDARNYKLECSNRFGAYTCAYYFYNYLKNKGIPASKGYGDVNYDGFVRTTLSSLSSGIKAPQQRDIIRIGSSLSSPLSEIVRDANRMSDNFFAETMLRSISLKKAADVEYSVCREVLTESLIALGLDANQSCQIFDGSGLSRKNYVSPEFFVNFLRLMAVKPFFDIYLGSLPIPGEKGTLEYRLPSAQKSLRSRIHAKSGSMNGVRCYSGYILASDGDPKHTVVFSLLSNNVIASSSEVNPSLDKILEAIAAEN